MHIALSDLIPSRPLLDGETESWNPKVCLNMMEEKQKEGKKGKRCVIHAQVSSPTHEYVKLKGNDKELLRISKDGMGMGMDGGCVWGSVCVSLCVCVCVCVCM